MGRTVLKRVVADAGATVAVSVLLLMMGCAAEDALDTVGISSVAVVDDGVLPIAHLCTGFGSSPPVDMWTDGDAIVEYAIVLESVEEDTVHWVLWGIPGRTGAVMASIPRHRAVYGEYRQGTASDRNVGYDPPCPEKGESEELRVVAYGVSCTIGASLGAEATASDLRARVANCMVAQGEIRFWAIR